MAAEYFQFGYGSPDYSDWAGYAGLDRKTGMAAADQSSPVAPPTSMQDLYQQKIANPINAAVNKVSNAATNIGNIMGGKTQTTQSSGTGLSMPTSWDFVKSLD